MQWLVTKGLHDHLFVAEDLDRSLLGTILGKHKDIAAYLINNKANININELIQTTPPENQDILLQMPIHHFKKWIDNGLTPEVNTQMKEKLNEWLGGEQYLNINYQHIISKDVIGIICSYMYNI